MATKTKASGKDCCVPLPKAKVAALRPAQALELMGLFKMLANDTRLRLLHALVQHGELCVGSLAKTVDLSPQAVSNQLQRLMGRDILRPRRQGNLICYRIVNKCVTDLLDRGICLLNQECSEEST